MGHFSNGSEGMDYDWRYCAQCVHAMVSDEGICPVMDAHYEHNGSEVLDFFIPRSDGIHNDKCTMFIAKKKEATE